MEQQGWVYLVGSGPGDPGLITLKGLECLQKSQVVVYDRLISSRLLAYIPSSAQLIFTGKGPKKQAMSQEEINRILVEKAGAGLTVTRLKAGDPFVFGRGREEAEAMQAEGIPFEVVPGVTSAEAAPAYAGIEAPPLFGRRIMVTRPREQAAELSSQLEELGAEAVICPAIRIVPPSTYEPLDRAIGELDRYRWLVFTSINGVEHFFLRLNALGKDSRALAGLKLCAIGPGTAAGLFRRGLLVDLVPDRYVAEGIIEAMRERAAAGQKVLLPRAGEAREILPRELQKMGLEVNTVAAYHTRYETVDPEHFRKIFLLSPGLDAVTFTSSSTVQGFVSMLQAAGLEQLPDRTKIACIGPITADKARQLGFPVHVQADNYTISGLIQALVENMAGC